MLTAIVKKIFIIISHVKWGWDFVLHHSLFPSSPCSTGGDVLQMIDSHTVRQTVCSSDRNDAVVSSEECAVCLCGIGAGDEIRQLRCSHVFHRACFDRWVGYGRWTCPLCRNHLANTREMDGEIRREILLFSFANVSSSENKESWWLR